MKTVELRSDTFTLPTAPMREAMHRAELGDDVFAEDPTVNELEALAARVTGKEAALYVPSGCMANLIAQLVHVRRGDEVIVGQDAHIVRHEVGSGAAIAGAQYNVIPGTGLITAGEVEARIQDPTFHTPGTGLVWIENTHNMSGGRTVSVAETERIAAVAHARRLPVHLDGARLFNAAAALRVPASALTAPVDSVSFCLSKGLGAPVGSMLCGSGAFRRDAHRFRKMLGGGMRQAGVLAAAGIYALTHHVERLADDHARAQRLAEGLAGIAGIGVDPALCETNIVIARVADAPALVARCAAFGVRFLALGPRLARFITHLGVDDAGVERAIEVVRRAAS